MGSSNFLSERSTRVVILLRVILICLPLISIPIPQEWLYSPAVKSVLVRPYTLLSHVREARAIRDLNRGRFSDAYNLSKTIRVPPLMLAAITPVLNTSYPEIYFSLFLLFIDVLISVMLEEIGTQILSAPDPEKEDEVELPEAIRPPNAHIFPVSQQQTAKTATKSLFQLESLPLLSAKFYFWSPFVAMPVDIYCCYQNFATFFLLASLFESTPRRNGGSKTLSALFLAIATYIEMHYVVFLIPIIVLHNRSSNLHSTNNAFTSWVALQLLLLFGICSCCLHWFSYSLIGPIKIESVLEAVYGCGWRNMGPNLSVQWYFYMQLFSRFRNYFGTLILGLPYVAVAPLAIRLYKYPMELVAIFSLLWTIFRPVETLFDFNVCICFLLLCPKSLARMEKMSFVSICSMWVPVILYVVDYWMWLGPNTGNANYMFFQCLAYNIFIGIILGQFCSACVQRDKALRIVRKESELTTQSSE